MFRSSGFIYPLQPPQHHPHLIIIMMYIYHAFINAPSAHNSPSALLHFPCPPPFLPSSPATPLDGSLAIHKTTAATATFTPTRLVQGSCSRTACNRGDVAKSETLDFLSKNSAQACSHVGYVLCQNAVSFAKSH